MAFILHEMCLSVCLKCLQIAYTKLCAVMGVGATLLDIEHTVQAAVAASTTAYGAHSSGNSGSNITTDAVSDQEFYAGIIVKRLTDSAAATANSSGGLNSQKRSSVQARSKVRVTLRNNRNV